jgi:EAL domain-containing protein (putative c-di-GMP-specific phosphodiesterase class I)/PAS domain-containing protein
VLFDYARRKVAECDVDRVAVATALAGAQILPGTLGIAVNVHASTLGRDAMFVDFLVGAAHQCEIELSRLTVEVVEHAPVWNATEFLYSLRLMRELKIRVALDDVGTGRSNYRMILDAAPDCFKIDSYLVQTAHADHRRRSMLASILQLARDLGSSVVAEGVENAADLEAVLDLGITLIQGYIFSRALPIWELTNMQAGLRVLATMPSLASGDLRAFYPRAKVVLEVYPGARIFLADATGQEQVNTFLPFGAPLPKHSVPDAVHQVYATGRPMITDVFKGVLTGRYMISVHVPVFRDGRVVYDLAMNVAADRFVTVLLQQHLPPEWIGGIYDGNQVMVARTRFAEEFVGRHPNASLGQPMRNTAEGTSEGINFEGVRMFNSFSRSATSGWTVVIGVPKAIMMAEIWRWLWWTLGGTALLSFTSVGLALRMARRIAGSIQGLIAPALALGRGEPVTIGHLELKEFDEAVESLVTASQLIQQRAAERERAEATRRETEDLKCLNEELERSEAEARALATDLEAILDAVPAITFIAHDPACQRMTSNRAAYDLLRLPAGANTSKAAPGVDRHRLSAYCEMGGSFLPMSCRWNWPRQPDVRYGIASIRSLLTTAARGVSSAMPCRCWMTQAQSGVRLAHTSTSPSASRRKSNFRPRPRG